MAFGTLRERILRPTAFLRVLLLSSAAGAVIVGLLAMHTIAAPGANSDPAHAAMVVEGHDSPMIAGKPMVDGCDGMCDPAHDIGTMACILALLVTVLVFGASHRSSRLSFLHARGSPVAGSWRPSPRSLPPPDLTILSISRT
jgi:hypothetical protein